MSHGVSKTRSEVKDLQNLRRLYLESSREHGIPDYWDNEELIALYDATLARRIAWKWDALLAELLLRSWQIPASIARWVDWGCGSGIATETMLNHFALPPPAECVLSDRSLKARNYAAQKTRARLPSTSIHALPPEQLTLRRTDLMLLSHVLTELDHVQLNTVVTKIKDAGVVIWVEPGTPRCSQSLVEIRETLTETFDIVAPCPHSMRCPLNGNNKDWCHFFANPPADIFQNSQWAAISKQLNIDLRSLPVSFLVLQHKSLSPAASINTTRKKRLLARPRFYKGYAKVMFCRSDGASSTEQLQEKNFKQLLKDWQKNCFYAEITNDQDSD